MLASGCQELAIDGRHALSVSTLPTLHSDPFDRLLLAQAICEGLLLITSDRKLGAYDGLVRIV